MYQISSTPKKRRVRKQAAILFWSTEVQKVPGSNLMVSRGPLCSEFAYFTCARFYSPCFLGIFLNSTFAEGCLSGRCVVVCLSGFAQYLKAMCLLNAYKNI